MNPIYFDISIFGPILLGVINASIVGFFLVLRLLDSRDVGAEVISLYRFFSGFGALALSYTILRDMYDWPLPLNVSVFFFLIDSYALFLAVNRNRINSFEVKLVTLLHLCFVIPVFLISRFESFVLLCSLYGLLMYGFLAYRLVQTASRQNNAGYLVLALPCFLVALLSPIHLILMLFLQNYQLVFTLIITTYSACCILICYGFLASILVSNKQTMIALANSDPLTNLLNRRGLTKSVDSITKPNGKTLTASLIIADIDHFKGINDSYGHDAGDYILQQFAQILRSETRDSDCCARLGGEEFAILLPNTDHANACRLAERIRKRVEKNEFTYSRKKIAVTSSFGVATLPVNGSLDELIKTSDKALYEAKTNGRNRTISYGEMQACFA